MVWDLDFDPAASLDSILSSLLARGVVSLLDRGIGLFGIIDFIISLDHDTVFLEKDVLLTLATFDIILGLAIIRVSVHRCKFPTSTVDSFRIVAPTLGYTSAFARAEVHDRTAGIV